MPLLPSARTPKSFSRYPQIESRHNSDEACSDAKQQVTPAALVALLDQRHEVEIYKQSAHVPHHIEKPMMLSVLAYLGPLSSRSLLFFTMHISIPFL